MDTRWYSHTVQCRFVSLYFARFPYHHPSGPEITVNLDGLVDKYQWTKDGDFVTVIHGGINGTAQPFRLDIFDKSGNFIATASPEVAGSYFLDWSNDNQWLAFSPIYAKGVSAFNMKTFETTELIPPDNFTQLAWSPVYPFLAYTYWEDDTQKKIFVWESDTQTEHLLYQTSDLGVPTWSTKGERLSLVIKKMRPLGFLFTTFLVNKKPLWN